MYIIHSFCGHHIPWTILGLEKSPKGKTKKLEETAEKASWDLASKKNIFGLEKIKAAILPIMTIAYCSMC